MSGDATATGKQFTITRVFDAPRDLVFKVFAEKDHLFHWWGPKGLKMRTCEIDLRPGGVFHYCMVTPDGAEMWGKWAIREVVAPERIVWVNSFSDAQCGVTRHPMAPDWPAEILNVVTFEENNGKTTMMLRGGPINATEAERKIFEGNFESMNNGFGGTFDQLEAHLASLR